jgi:hypothetical protein
MIHFSVLDWQNMEVLQGLGGTSLRKQRLKNVRDSKLLG